MHTYSNLSVTFPSPSKASLVQQVLEVDDELQPTKICKTFVAEGSALKVDFVACDVKVLRVAISSFYDMLTVTLKTLREFDEGEDGQGGQEGGGGGNDGGSGEGR